jgi:SAM-dependent methyltransferase
MEETFKYVGEELDLFSGATNWKNYYGNLLRPYLGQDVLEVGAGLGGTTQVLCDGNQRSWLCLEPDGKLAEQIQARINAGTLPSYCQVRAETSDQLPANARFDSILYIDVIEHIDDDAAELRRAYQHLRPGGHLIIIVPAHQWLFSPFDEAVGHFRRYNKARLRAVIPPGMKPRLLRHLDSLGWTASCVNKLVLRQYYPTLPQVRFWDSTVVPVSKLTDPLVGYSFGKALLGIYQKS